MSMNLVQLISIYAGGEGSGPNAPCPQCGPKSKGEGEKYHGPKARRMPTTVKHPLGPHGVISPHGKELPKSFAKPFHTPYARIKDIPKPSAQEMYKWKQQHPGDKTKPSILQSGDIVKTKADIKLWNQKTGNVDTIPPGTKATVVNVLPKIGTGEQMVSVQVRKYDPEYMKVKDVEFHKSGKAEQIEDIKPVRKGQVITKFKTADGADVTWVKPHAEGKEKDPKTLADIFQEKHYLYGKFAQTNRVEGISDKDKPGYNRVTRIFDTTSMPVAQIKGSNATVWVDSYTKQGKIKEVHVMEQNVTTYSQKTRGALTFEYKNAAAAVGMLKSRYGIKTSLKRLRS